MNETNEPVDHPIMGFLGHKGHEMLPRGNAEEILVLFKNSIERNLKKINNIFYSSFKWINLKFINIKNMKIESFLPFFAFISLA